MRIFEDKYEEILVEKKHSIAIVKFHRPDRLNAYTLTMGAELYDAFAELDDDDSVRCIIVTGSGKAFCVGAELEGGLNISNDERRQQTRERVAESKGFRQLSAFQVRKPVIAAINGNAVGLGLTFPLHYDIRITAEDAKLGFVFTRRGLTPEAASTWILPRIIGISKANELMLTGRIFSGKEALDMGLVSQAVPKEQVLDTAVTMAEDIATYCAPMALAWTKRQLWAYLGQSNYEAASEKENDIFTWFREQPDVEEGIRSFIEKREPSWQSNPSDNLPFDPPSLI